jgi:hypothetical protein
VFHTLSWLEHLELQGVRVLNGAKAFQYEISKALQHSLLPLGLRYPKSRVIHQATREFDAVGGSGKGIQRFDTLEQLSLA